MTAPAWLDGVLAEHAHLNLDHPDGRSLLAEAILQALSPDALQLACRTGVDAVSNARGLGLDQDARSDIARNAAQAVLLLLEAP